MAKEKGLWYDWSLFFFSSLGNKGTQISWMNSISESEIIPDDLNEILISKLYLLFLSSLTEEGLQFPFPKLVAIPSKSNFL